MMTWPLLTACLCLAHFTASVQVQKIKDAATDFSSTKNFLDAAHYAAILDEIQDNTTLKDIMDRQFDVEGRDNNIHYTMDFPCDVLPPSRQVPKSVHKLRPGDIKVVAAIGDSITAGRGSGTRSVLGLQYDYRGLSWSIGGDESFKTFQSLPNILKQYNPKLYGFSTGKGGPASRTAGFNAAISGARSNKILAEAVQMIIKMKADPSVDFYNDWKHVTILIGGNDLCQQCLDQQDNSPHHYSYFLLETLSLLQAFLPRTLVSVVEVMPVDIVQDVIKFSKCAWFLKRECACAAFPQTKADAVRVKRIRRETQALTERLIKKGQFDTKDDFTVVLQPLVRSMHLPRDADGAVDLSYFAADCFHISRKGHSVFAMALWNNLFEPVGKKTAFKKLDTGIKMRCPTDAEPYIYTRLNSKAVQSEDIADIDDTTTAAPSTWYYSEERKYLPPVMVFLGICFIAALATLITYRFNRCQNSRLYERMDS